MCASSSLCLSVLLSNCVYVLVVLLLTLFVGVNLYTSGTFPDKSIMEREEKYEF